MPDTLCSDPFDDWKDAYDDWESCKDDLGEVKEDYWKAVAAAEIACGGAVALSETIVGGIIGGAACAVALWNMYDAADDISDKITKCNGLASKSDAKGEKYKKCVSDHKHDPNLPD